MRYKKGSFITVPSSMLWGAGPGPQAVYLWLCDFANKDGECFPSRTTLAALTGCSERSIDTYLEVLIDRGLVKKETRFDDSRQTSNLYYLPILDPDASQNLRPPLAESAIPPLAESAHRTQPSIELNKKKASDLENETEESSDEDDYTQTPVDPDTGEELTYHGLKKRREKREPRNAVALRVTRKFNELASQALGVTIVNHPGGYFVALSALKYLSEQQIVDELLPDWFDAPGKDENKASITAALSTHSINRFKARYGI